MSVISDEPDAVVYDPMNLQPAIMKKLSLIPGFASIFDEKIKNSKFKEPPFTS